MPVWISNPVFAVILNASHQQNPPLTLDLDPSGRKISMIQEALDPALRVGYKRDAKVLGFLDVVAGPRRGDVIHHRRAGACGPQEALRRTRNPVTTG